MDGIKTQLVQMKIKPTYIRLRILKYLAGNMSHPAADEIYREISKEIPTLSKMSVYNCLNLYLKAGLVQAISIPGSETRFEKTDKAHHHFFCIICNSIYDIDSGVTCEVFKNAVSSGHMVNEVHGSLKGICFECRKK